MIFLVVFLNFWIWKIFPQNSLLGLTLVVTSLLLYFVLQKNRFTYLYAGTMVILLIIQLQTTRLQPLDYLSSPEKSLQIQRLNSYPPIYINLFDKPIYFPIAHNLEERKILHAPETLQKNLLDNLDLNLYFFAGHPREGTFLHHFPKFPFFYLIFFLIGLFTTRSWTKKTILFSLAGPMALLSLIGNNNIYGPFIFFPFITVMTALGAEQIISKWGHK